MSEYITLGRHSYIGTHRVHVWGKTDCKVRVGNFTSIADDCDFMLFADHRTKTISTFPFPSYPENWKTPILRDDYPLSKGDIIIGNDVWIGLRSLILSGVTIGDGAVIGAGSVVSKPVAPYAIVCGNPAREVKKRFDDKKIEELLQSKWWEWTDDKIQDNIGWLMN